MSKLREFLLLSGWIILIGFAWLGPALWGYAMHITDYDTGLQYYPYFDFYSKALQSGQSFLWMPGIFSGFPIYLTQSGGFLDPLNILIYSFFDGINGTHFRLFLDFVAMNFFSYLAARSFGLSRVASALIGPSFLIAFHIRFLSNPLLSNALYIIPLLLFVVQGLLGEFLKYRYAIAVLVCGVGIALLSGYTQVICYAFLATGLYVLLVVFLQWGRWEVDALVKKFVVFTVGVFGGVIVGLPFILPAFDFLPISARAIAPTYEQATLKVVELTDLVLFVIPDNFYIPYITSGEKPLYVGALWSLFVFAAITQAIYLLFTRFRKLTLRDAELVALAITCLTLLVASIEHSPLYYVMSYLPVIGQFRFPYRLMFVGAFFLALLGGLGFDWVYSKGHAYITRVVTVVWSLGVSAVLAIIIFFNSLGSSGAATVAYFIQSFAESFHLYEVLGMTKGHEHYAAMIVQGLDAGRELLSFRDSLITIPTCILFIAFGLVWTHRFAYLNDVRFRISAAVLTVATVISIPVLRYQYFVLPVDAGMKPHVALKNASLEDLDQYRMYSFLPSAAVSNYIPPQYKLSADEDLAVLEYSVLAGTPNYHLYHDLDSVDGYDQFESLDTLSALESIGSALSAGYGSGSNVERTERLLGNLDILGMMGGKYIISGVRLDHQDLRLLSLESYTTYGIPLYLYELNARPRYYFATSVVALPHSSFRELLEQDVSFAKKTYIDCEDCYSMGNGGSVELIRSENGLYELQTTSAQDGVLVLSESFIKGWRANVDGNAVEVLRANGLYMAVIVPSGTHHVQFEFQGLFNELHLLKKIKIVRE